MQTLCWLICHPAAWNELCFRETNLISPKNKCLFQQFKSKMFETKSEISHVMYPWLCKAFLMCETRGLNTAPLSWRSLAGGEVEIRENLESSNKPAPGLSQHNRSQNILTQFLFPRDETLCSSWNMQWKYFPIAFLKGRVNFSVLSREAQGSELKPWPFQFQARSSDTITSTEKDFLSSQCRIKSGS